MKKLFTILLVFAILLFGGFTVLNKLKGNNQYSKFSESFHIIYGDRVLPKEQTMREDGQFYISLEGIQENFDKTAHYDEGKKAVIFNSKLGEKFFLWIVKKERLTVAKSACAIPSSKKAIKYSSL